MNWRRFSARAVDTAMCAMMYTIQRRHRLNSTSGEALARYVQECSRLSRDEYFRHDPAEIVSRGGSNPQEWTWTSPITSGYSENNRAFVLHFPAPGNERAPTVFFLHALMSTSDVGYRRWAARFNASGWSACFVHLPFHYSRVPRGFRNGELAITADLVRTAEGLRQAVAELRQLMGWLRHRGVGEFGLWACSYGAWIGALLASVESDFRFAALIEPIVNVHHAIWQSPAGLALRRELRRHGIRPDLPARHFPLTCPSHGQPLCGPERVLLVAGEYDTIAQAQDIAALHKQWPGSAMITEPQGHFGFQLMASAWRWIDEKGWLEKSTTTTPESTP